MLCQSITITGTTTALKAVAFGQFWADNLNDAALKAAAAFGVLKMGDRLTDDPVFRDGTKAYVVFVPSTLNYTELGIMDGMKAILGALYTWAKANPGSLLALVGVTTLAYIAIEVIDWQTKIQDASMSADDTVNKILGDTTLTGDQKLKLLMEYLGIKDQGSSSWTDMIIPGVVILGLAYVGGQMFGGKK